MSKWTAVSDVDYYEECNLPREAYEGECDVQTGPHHHPCGRCGVKTECCGTVEQEYGGTPEWVCTEYHTLSDRRFHHRDDFICEGCENREDDRWAI